MNDDLLTRGCCDIDIEGKAGELTGRQSLQAMDGWSE